MDPITFQIIPESDREYVDAFEKMRTEGTYLFEKASMGLFNDIPGTELRKNIGLQEILSQNMRVFPSLTFTFPNNYSVRIQRTKDSNTLFDQVSVGGHSNVDPVEFTKLAAAVQKNLGHTSLLNIGTLLGPAAAQHFEAREIALARLEKISSTMLAEMESARKKREQDYEAKEKALEVKIEQRTRELEEVAKARQQALDNRAEALEQLQKELDDRAAKHARRQHYKDIKEKFKSWSETFQVTDGTKYLRRTVLAPIILMMAISGVVAGWFLFQSITIQDSNLMISIIVKQIAFTVLFFSTGYFLIRWSNQWFQRHANEEFRLKRMELDIDRASWVVEMAFEWKDEKGQEIPMELIERLTHGLFEDALGEHSVEPADSLAQAVLGAARLKVKLGDGTEAEYDRKAINKLQHKKQEKRPP